MAPSPSPGPRWPGCPHFPGLAPPHLAGFGQWGRATRRGWSRRGSRWQRRSCPLRAGPSCPCRGRAVPLLGPRWPGSAAARGTWAQTPASQAAQGTRPRTASTAPAPAAAPAPAPAPAPASASAGGPWPPPWAKSGSPGAEAKRASEAPALPAQPGWTWPSVSLLFPTVTSGSLGPEKRQAGPGPWWSETQAGSAHQSESQRFLGQPSLPAQSRR